MTSSITIDEHVVNQAITPLRLIFWGGLLCIFDFNLSQTFNGNGFKFDVLSDAVGTILIAAGVFRLSALPIHDQYKSKMKFVKVVAVIAVVDALQDHFIPPLLPLGYLAFNLFGVLNLAAIIVFCVAMRWFCEETRLLEASQSWGSTTLLFALIYVAPLGLLYLIGTLNMAQATSANFDFGPLAILALPLFAVPLIHLFMSTSRMKRAAAAWRPLSQPGDPTGLGPGLQPRLVRRR